MDSGRYGLKTKILVSLAVQAADWDYYLLSHTINAKMSHLVEDFAVSANVVRSRFSATKP